MLDTDTKRRIDTARDILVGKVPDPKSQVEHFLLNGPRGHLSMMWMATNI